MRCTFQQIYEAFADAGYEPRKYSGRAGASNCFGVEFDSGSAVEVVCSVLEMCDGDILDKLIHDLKGASEDNMGLGFIVYWPDIAWEDGFSRLTSCCAENATGSGEHSDECEERDVQLSIRERNDIIRAVCSKLKWQA